MQSNYAVESRVYIRDIMEPSVLSDVCHSEFRSISKVLWMRDYMINSTLDNYILADTHWITDVRGTIWREGEKCNTYE